MKSAHKGMIHEIFNLHSLDGIQAKYSPDQILELIRATHILTNPIESINTLLYFIIGLLTILSFKGRHPKC